MMRNVCTRIPRWQNGPMGRAANHLRTCPAPNDAFSSVMGRRRGHAGGAGRRDVERLRERLFSSDGMRLDLISRVTQRIRHSQVKVVAVDVLPVADAERRAGALYVRIGCDNVDDCEHAMNRMLDHCSTTEEEWRSGWAEHDGLLTLRVFDPAPLS
jgi:hypothetical protein